MVGNRSEPMMVEEMPGGKTMTDFDGAQELTANTSGDVILMEDKDPKAENKDVETDSELAGGVSTNVMEEPAKELNCSKKLAKAPEKRRKRLGEEVCFICCDGGELFLCDRKSCNKAYHPVCVKRDEAFLRAKGVWVCGWHICSICEKDAYYKCYTCIYSLCRGCVKDGAIFCVRRNKGFCESCLGLVRLIENMDEGNKKVDFGDNSTFEFLFKEYWVGLKEKLSLSSGEIALAKNPCKKTVNVLTVEDKSQNGQLDVDYLDCSADSDSSPKLLEVAETSKKIKSKKTQVSHLPSNADSQVDGTELNEEDGNEKRRKICKKMDVRGSNLQDYAAIDAHNINLIFLRRNLMEALLDDTDTFHNKVVGTFVRIRISSSNQNQDVYRLVQVIGTIKVDEPYQIGRRRKSNILLEISNLGKSEITPIHSISNQQFSEDECKRLKQSVKCGLVDRLTVGQVLDKALDLQHARVTNWLETEIKRLSYLRDRASEKGHVKELRECVEKLKILKTPEERLRMLEEVPEVLTDPNMDPTYELDDDHTEADPSEKEGSKRLKGGGLDTDPLSKSKSSAGILSEDLPLSSGTGSAKGIEGDKIWHYEDPTEKIQGPFSMAQLRRWSEKGYFPAGLRVWRSEARTDSVLLIEALAGKFKTETVVPSRAEVPKVVPPEDKNGPIHNSETQGVLSSATGSTGTPNPNQMWAPPICNQGETLQRSVPGFGDPTWVARPWDLGNYYQGPPPISGAGWVPATIQTPIFPLPNPPPQPRGSAPSWIAAADPGISGQLAILPPTPPPLPAPTLPPPPPGNPGWVSQARDLGVLRSVVHHNRDGWSGSVKPWGRQASHGSRGRQWVCPFHRNGHCKKGASCNHLHI